MDIFHINSLQKMYSCLDEQKLKTKKRPVSHVLKERNCLREKKELLVCFVVVGF